jgi:four helix bundle protein
MQDYHRLVIWQRSMAFAVDVYRFAGRLPDTERFNLSAQLRSAVASVPLNIAEGSGCRSRGDVGRVLGYAYRSLKEVCTALELSERLFPEAAPSAAALISESSQLARMTHALISRVGAPQHGHSKLTTQN